MCRIVLFGLAQLIDQQRCKETNVLLVERDQRWPIVRKLAVGGQRCTSVADLLDPETIGGSVDDIPIDCPTVIGEYDVEQCGSLNCRIEPLGQKLLRRPQL